MDAPFRRHRNVPCWRCRQRQERKGASMERVSVIGIDLAKNSFQAHGARADGSVAVRRKLRRAKILDFMASQPRCTVVMEACASAHYWGREVGGLGHSVQLIPPVYVKAYVKRQKKDAADAEAICEAASRPTMSFVAVKTKEGSVASLAKGRCVIRGLPVHLMILRWPDGPVAMPWPRSGRTVRDRRRARRSGPRRQCRPGGRTSRPGPCAARASPRSP